MLAGRFNKKTGAFSANHSYYDSSHINEYFKSSQSVRVLSVFQEKITNKITVYPVFSPSKLNLKVKIFL